MTSLRTRQGRIEYLYKRNNILDRLHSSAGRFDFNRVRECTKSVIDGYTKATNIGYMARVVKERNLECYRFRAIVLHYLIDRDKFLARDYYWGHYFLDAGRAMARGEEKYFHRRISSFSTSMCKEIYYKNPDFTMINEGIRMLKGKNFNPNVVLLPIELHSSFLKHYHNRLEWSSDGRSELLVENCNLNIFWSYKYAPLKSVIIFDSNCGIWHVLEDKNTKNNISFAIGESEQRKDKIEYFIETLAYYYANREAFIKIKLSH